MLTPQFGNQFIHGAAAWLTDDIRDEQDFPRITLPLE